MAWPRRKYGNKKRSHPARWNLQHAKKSGSTGQKSIQWANRPANKRPRGWFF